MFGLTIVQPPHCGGWTLFTSNGSNLTGVCASSGAVNCGTVKFNTNSVGTYDIRTWNWTDIMAYQNFTTSPSRYLIYKNISNTNILKTEWADNSGHASNSVSAQSVFGNATILAFNGISQIGTSTTNGVVEVHYGDWVSTNNTNWILSNNSRPYGAGITNNYEIDSHGVVISINGITYLSTSGDGLFCR